MLIESSQWVDPMQVSSWGKELNSPQVRERLFSHSFRKGDVVYGTMIYYIEYPRQEYELFAFEDNNPAKKFVYYCKIITNSTRNGLFKPSVGFSTSAVWRHQHYVCPGFALAVYKEFICKKLIDKCIISDLQQTPNGWFAFTRLASEICKDGWKVYAGFSVPRTEKVIVPMTVNQLIDAQDFLLGNSTAYGYRCAVLLNKGIRIKDILNRPKSTHILTYKEAEMLGVFGEPHDLLIDEEDLFFEEIRPRQKHD